jgi:hypothetical protein
LGNISRGEAAAVRRQPPSDDFRRDFNGFADPLTEL